VPNRKDINKCPICKHPKRAEIEDHILKHTKSYRQMQADYGPYPALYSIHKKGHMPEKVAAAQAEQEAWDIHDGFRIMKYAKEIYDEALGSAREARERKQYGAIGSCLNPATKVLELLKTDDPGKPAAPKDGGLMAGYMKRAAEVYASPQD
jgi:hypothetical protein